MSDRRISTHEEVMRNRRAIRRIRKHKEAERHREIGRMVEGLGKEFHTVVLSGSTVVLGGETDSTVHRAPTLVEALRKAAGEG